MAVDLHREQRLEQWRDGFSGGYDTGYMIGRCRAERDDAARALRIMTTIEASERTCAAMHCVLIGMPLDVALDTLREMPPEPDNDGNYRLIVRQLRERMERATAALTMQEGLHDTKH